MSAAHYLETARVRSGVSVDLRAVSRPVSDQLARDALDDRGLPQGDPAYDDGPRFPTRADALKEEELTNSFTRKDT